MRFWIACPFILWMLVSMVWTMVDRKSAPPIILIGALLGMIFAYWLMLRDLWNR